MTENSWEWRAAKQKLSAARNKLNRIVTKVPVENLFPYAVHRARVEYDEALATVSLMQKQMKAERRRKKREGRL